MTAIMAEELSTEQEKHIIDKLNIFKIKGKDKRGRESSENTSFPEAPPSTCSAIAADEVEAPPSTCAADEVEAPPSTSSAIAAAEVQLESLSIDYNDPEDVNIQAVTAGDTPYTSATRFEELNISSELLKGLYIEMKFEKPSKIQSISLPMILTPPYKNLIAQAHNGSGKTTCFVLGILSRVDPTLHAPQAICICPTRELAIQNIQVLSKMAKFTGITSELGLPIVTKRQPEQVTSQVIIGTPGTINRWITKGTLLTSKIKIVVFDEADHMLAEGGFKDESLRIMRKINKSTPKPEFQVLLFSATFNETVKEFVSSIMKELSSQEYNQLFVKKEELSLDSVKQYKVEVPDEVSKIMVIKDKIMELGQKVGQTIIFVRTRNSAGMLHQALRKYGYEVTTIQGALNQEDRDKIIKEFKDGLTQVLISTDVLARGFDQSQVNLVVNFDLPIKFDSPTDPDYEVYLHRIGRAGRFGRKGAVFNLLCGKRDAAIMEKIEKHFNHYVTKVSSWEKEEEFEDALKKAGLM